MLPPAVTRSGPLQLTPLQQKVYQLLRRSEPCPSYREIRSAVKASSTSVVFGCIDVLLEKGLISKGHGARSIKVVGVMTKAEALSEIDRLRAEVDRLSKLNLELESRCHG